MKKNKKYDIISCLLVIIYIGLIVITNVYYNSNIEILECIKLIGTINKCISTIQNGQDSIIFTYKMLAISSYVMIFVNLFFNIYFAILNLKNKQRQTLPLILIIVFSIITTIFLINLFMI